MRLPRWVRVPRRPSWPTLVVLLAYLVAALAIMWPLWTPLGDRTSAVNPGDMALFTWLMEWPPHAVAHGENPWFSDAINAPTGVNLMWNNGMSLPALALWPVSALFGGLATVAVLLTLGMAGSAATAYAALRSLSVRIGPAAIGGALFGFSPAMLAQTHGHPNLVFNVLAPVIVLLVVRLVTNPEPRRRDAILLGLTAAAQVLIGEEILLLTGIVAVLLVAALALSRPELARQRARPVGLRAADALGVFVVLAALPLGFQLFGPLEQHGLPFDPAFYSADLAGYVVPTELQQLSTEATRTRSEEFPGGLEEHTAYLGWPLIALCVGLLVLWWRSLRVRIALLTAVVVAVFALGERLTIDGQEKSLRLPWDLLNDLPFFEHVVQTRFAIFTIGLIGAAVAFALDDLATRPLPIHAVGWGVVALAVIPLLPARYDAADAPQVPDFFTDRAGEALGCDGTVLVLPYPSAAATDPMLWQAASGFAFSMPGGYFIGPDETGQARFGGAGSFTRSVFERAYLEGVITPATAGARREFASDLDDWDVCAAVIGPGFNHATVLGQAVRLIGAQPEPAGGDVLIWRDLSEVRALCP
jgi:hypothetical protein